VALFRRHGITTRKPDRKPDTTFWPDQVLRDAIVCLGVMIVVLLLVVRNLPSTDSSLSAGERFGPELGAPADPAENYSAARPENYFLFLFQILRFLEAFPPVVGAIVVPGLVMLSLVMMPIIGRWDLGHRFNVVWTIAMLIGAGVLTAIALRDDYNGQTEHSRHYLAAVEEARSKARRAMELAGSPHGIPPSGALTMLQSDPMTQGPRLFRQHCAACHSHAPDDDSSGSMQFVVAENPTAPNLWRFATREWVRGLLNAEKIAGPQYFGNTAHRDGDMVTFVQDIFGADAVADLDEAEREAQRRQVEDITIALANEAGMNGEMVADLDERVAAGREAIVNEFACTDCHKFHDEGGLGMAPDLTGYGSREWLREFISNPEHERFYPDTNDRMPAFAAGADGPASNRLSADQLDLLVRWLRGEWYEPNAKINPPADAAE
jgi:ubiquinol-cytochrome c reductase cytochrome b subunit